MTETTCPTTTSLLWNWLLRIIAVVVAGKLVYAGLVRLLYELAVLDTALAIVMVLAGLVAVIVGVPMMVFRIGDSLAHDMTQRRRYRREDNTATATTASSAPQSPADHLPDADARVAHEFSDGREIVPQSLAERDPIEYELKREWERDR